MAQKLLHYLRHTAAASAVAIVATVATAGAAQAIPFDFNFTYGGGSGQTYTPSGPGTLLWQADTVTEGLNQIILTSQSVSGPAAGAVGDVIDYVALPFDVPTASSGILPAVLNVTWGGIYSFASVSGTYLRDPVNNALNFSWLGFFEDSTGVLNTQGAAFSQTWSQAVAGIQPSTSGTFNSTPQIVVPIPEPATLLLFGAGLIGIGAIARRKQRQT